MSGNRRPTWLLAAALLSGGLLLAPAAVAAPLADPVLALPFATGQQTYSAGVHSDNGQSGVKNAIDFSPGDGVARSAAEGTVRIQRCSGGDWVTVDHAGGWRTGYYHLEDIQVHDGQSVSAGTPLGRTGNALPCGGSSSGAHVHFTLWQLGAAPGTEADWSGLSYAEVSTRVAAEAGVPVDGKVLGAWRFRAGSRQYSGRAERVGDGFSVSLPGRFRV
ncbi:M23 family metallopeptidase [Crossiella sp. CA-258035]|uniref:M23 family metallopeptidase n=1 Tax=Crossiella sp. CA-258035 TaxID=2981138 RepID=UPI0024BD0DEA|nr:M23 family metallopeptidase [Crossiella sp. CA-258035]WHT21372.1 M23 family metallopeptidase [Crossiella sp. CA-258035]